MFGFGNQNKEKLEENMEEIKRMVDEESDMPDLEESHEWQQMDQEEWDAKTEDENQASSQDQTGQMEEIDQSESGQAQQEQQPEPQPEQRSAQQEQQNQQGQPRQEQSRQQPQGEEFESFNDTISGSEELQNEIESFEQSMEQEMQDEAWEVQQNEQGRREPQPTPKKNSGSSRNRSSAVADIPEPAKTKEIDVPEIEKGPLFIRQNKFERATQLIYDMKYLSDEIQSIVNAIEGDLERDRETENQLIEALSEFEDGRTQVERIISPGEE